MLERANSLGLVVTGLGEKGVHVETAYFDIQIKREKPIDGGEELWTRIQSRPAFEVAMLTRQQEPRVILMKKRHFVESSGLMRLPGGYLRGEKETNIPEKIETDTGIRLEFSDLIELGHVIGHPEIKTPIELYYTWDWKQVGAIGPGIQIFDLPLVEAVKTAMGGFVESDSTFAALMRLYCLWKEGDLVLWR